MFTRIHTLKFPNQLAKEAMRDKFVSIVDGFFTEGLLLYPICRYRRHNIIFYKFMEK